MSSLNEFMPRPRSRPVRPMVANSTIPRLGYRVDELTSALGVSRDTIDRRIKDGTLKAGKVLGVRLIEPESVRALFEPGE